MTNDIVARLREEGFITHMARLPRESKILHEAADEIERLRKELDGAQLAYRGASYDRDRMRSDRDEARRKICEIESQCICDPPRSPQKYAYLMGWDCFKEASNER